MRSPRKANRPRFRDPSFVFDPARRCASSCGMRCRRRCGCVGSRIGLRGTRSIPQRCVRGSSEFRFVAATPGAWHYWAGAVGARVPTSDADGQLVGALVVDSLSGAARSREDRVLVLTRWNPTGSRSNEGFQLNAFNGRSWPNTERLTYTANDSVRWHVINASNTSHEMHLHGFFFRIDGRGFAIDSALPMLPVGARMRVTSVMRPGEWIKIAWLPDRPGNWLFHCHLLTHMSGAQRLDRMAETATTTNELDHATDASGHHAEHDMGGLVMALDIKPS